MSIPAGYIPIGTMSVTDPANAWGFMDQPGFQGTDRICDLTFVNAYEQDHVRYDPVAKCVYAEPIFVPHHNLRTGYDLVGWLTAADGQLVPDVVSEEEVREDLPAYPVMRWRLVNRSGQTDLVSCVVAPLDYTGFRAQLTPGKEHDEDGMSFVVESDSLPDGCRGFYLFKRLSAGKEVADQERTLAFELWVSDDRYWRIDYSNPLGLRLYEFKDGTLRRLSRMASTQSFAEASGQEKFLPDEHGTYAPVVHIDQTSCVVMLLNKLIQIWVHGQAQPLVIHCPDFDEFTKIRVVGKGGRYAYFSAHPMCFAASAYMVANEHNAGFVRRSSTPIEYRVAKSTPAGCSVSASTEWEQGQEFRYKLQFENTAEGSYKGVAYSRSTGTATGVTYRIAPYVVRRMDQTGLFSNIREAQITTKFDWDNLTITSTAKVVMNNRHGEWRNGWPYGDGLGKGERAVTLDLGWRREDGVWVANRRFTGIGGIDWDFSRGPAPESTVTLTCEDLSIRCREYPLMSSPWMDGWCHLYAMRYLGWCAGLTDEQMPFEYCPNPDCSNQNHYHLPMGEGFNPRVFFAPGTSVWQAMHRIRKLTGHVLYFDAFGLMRYYPWVRTSPGPAKRIFYDSPAAGIDPFQTIERAGFSRTTRTVRTGLTIVGVNAYGPAWDPIVVHRDNAAAQYDKRAPNYCGRRKPMAWADPMFADLEYATEAADNVAPVVFLPGETMRLHFGLAMSDLFPLDVIGLYDTEMPTSEGWLAKAFFITRTVESFYCTRSRQGYTMDVDGRWIV